MNLGSYIKRPEDRSKKHESDNLILESIFSRKGKDSEEEDGGLLNYVERFSYGTINPALAIRRESRNQEIFYVVSGDGEIKSNEEHCRIKKDYTFLVPANKEYSITNFSDKNPLELLIVEEEAPKNSNNRIIIKNSEEIPFVKINPPLHWCHRAKSLFNYQQDNLSQVHYASLVYIDKSQLPEPHKHFPGHDEVWHALEGKTKMAFKNRLFQQNPGTSILIPDNGEIEHASITDKEDAKFFFFMHHMALDNRLLITGSEGKIGKIVTNHLRENGYQFITELDRENPKNPVDILKEDITPYFRGIDAVIHLAANPDPFIGKERADNNINITKRIIEACKNFGIKRIINGSSIDVYSYRELSRINKFTRLEPNRTLNPGAHYGRAKIECERLFEEYCNENKVSLLNLRLGELTEVDKEIGLKRADLMKIIMKAINYNGIGSYVCVSKKGRLVDDSIRFLI